MRLRNLFAASRFVIGLAVLGSFVGSAILLVIATVTLFRIAWNEIVNFDPDESGRTPRRPTRRRVDRDYRHHSVGHGALYRGARTLPALHRPQSGLAALAESERV